jgi:hypothetical protein
MSSLVAELCPKVNALIGEMFDLVKKIISSNNLSIREPIGNYGDERNQPNFSGSISSSGSVYF